MAAESGIHCFSSTRQELGGGGVRAGARAARQQFTSKIAIVGKRTSPDGLAAQHTRMCSLHT